MVQWAIVLNDKVIKRFTINEGSKLTIGRGSEADIIVDNTAISRKHTAFELRDGIYYVSDEGSLNGTFVNGEKIESPVPVSENDTIKIGKFGLIPGDNSDQEEADSFAMPMDIEDETVFIPNRKEVTKNPGHSKKPSHSLSLISGKAKPDQLALDGKSSIKLGKDTSCDMTIPGWFVAAAQCYIIRRDEKYLIVPQRSWSATSLNGMKIKNEQILRKGDIIDIRSTKLRFE